MMVSTIKYANSILIDIPERLKSYQQKFLPQASMEKKNMEKNHAKQQ